MDAKEETCQVNISGSGRDVVGHRCGRPVVGTVSEFGRSVRVCKLHKRVAERREERNRDWKSRYDSDAQFLSRLKVLSEETGLKIGGYYPVGSKNWSRDHVVVNLADLCRALGVDAPE